MAIYKVPFTYTKKFLLSALELTSNFPTLHEQLLRMRSLACMYDHVNFLAAQTHSFTCGLMIGFQTSSNLTRSHGCLVRRRST